MMNCDLRIYFIVIIFLLQSVCCLSCKSQNNETGIDIKLIPPDAGVYHGAFPDMGETEDSVTSERIQQFIDLTGKSPAWVYFSNNWFNGIKFPRDEVLLINKYGLLPFIRLMPRSNWNTDAPDQIYTLQNIINGKFDEELLRWARDAKKSDVPIMVEFGTEVNGDWFPWCGIYNGGGETTGYGDSTLADGPERFVNAYKHIIDLFAKENVKNVTWAFHVNSGSAPNESWNNYLAYYPGDEYIDWIGVSVYGMQNSDEDWLSFNEVFDNSYNKLASVSENKPLAIFEFGVADIPKYGDKAQWIKKALGSIREGKYPRIKAISYWQSSWENEDGSITKMRIDSNPESLKGYREYIADPFFIAFPILSRKNH